MTTIYQTRRNAAAAWTTLAADPWAWTNGIAEAMQLAGLRYSELALHLEDMRNGEVLTADNGHQFRAVDAAKAEAEAVAANQADYAAWKSAQGAEVAVLAHRTRCAVTHGAGDPCVDAFGWRLGFGHVASRTVAEPADPQPQHGYVSEYGPQH